MVMLHFLTSMMNQPPSIVNSEAEYTDSKTAMSTIANELLSHHVEGELWNNTSVVTSILESEAAITSKSSLIEPTTFSTMSALSKTNELPLPEVDDAVNSH
jgi:hypothetical protein